MTFGPFYQLFPEIASEETRTITFFNDDEEEETYYLADAYCTIPDCDCRRVFFNVLHKSSSQPVTVITWGWENRKFYEQCFPGVGKDMMDHLVGVNFNMGSPRCDGDERFLDVVKELVKTNDYSQRIKRHYKLYKEALKTLSFVSTPARVEKIGRNELCPCGSGKKYKKCCLGK